MLKIGIIGIGGMGNVHINNIELIDFAEVSALCDISPSAKDKAEEIGAKLFTDIEQMLRETRLDAVCVCTPSFLHYDHIKKVVSAGVNAISEKPLALNSRHAKELFDIADKNKAMIFVAHVIRFWDEYAMLREIVFDKRYGEVLDAEFLRLSACPKWIKGGWLFDKNKSGHIPFDLHIHDLDFLISLFGKPEEYSFTSSGGGGRDFKEHYRFTYYYPDKVVAAQASWYNADYPFTAAFRVYFKNAVVEYDSDKLMVYGKDAKPVQLESKTKIEVDTGINVPATGAYYNELLHFLECIRDKKESDMFKREELIAVIEILEEINKEI
ncbi:MAG: Gfo/Idh/MocA family oxidoreductase [Clostridia bacterium]|nr:Gfo/Idh/MocA family oxidoreductase [Clostridia bacterium]